METKIGRIFLNNLAKFAGKSKKITAFLLAAFIGTGVVQATGAYLNKKDSDITYGVSQDAENLVGYNDIDVYYNKDVYSNNFVILHISNKPFQDISMLKAKLEKCNKANISVGLVLDTDASTLADIYDDVDFLQAVVKDFKIDLPIYCNINNIMANETLNNAQKSTLIQAFIDKASLSNMFLGLYGTDSSLYNFNEFIFDITDYDCYLVEDSQSRKYNGTATIVEGVDGRIIASNDLAQIITSRGLNDPSKMVYSALYTVKDGDSFSSLALEYGLSVDDLRKYNNDLGNELKIGDILKIPNMYIAYDANKEQLQYNYVIGRGIDISDYQTKFDWNRISETSDYVIVEVARDGSDYLNNSGSYLNSASSQIRNVLSNNIDLGLYFCISKDMNMEVYKERLNNYLTLLKNDLADIDIDYSNVPIFLDFEVYYEYNDYYGLMNIFEKVGSKYGFKTFGIYGNTSTLRSISDNMEIKHNISLKDTDWIIWQSGGPQYSANEFNDPGISIDSLVEIDNEADSKKGFVPDIRQVTNVCIDTGAANGTGHCDVSFLYTEDIFGNELPSQEDLIDVMEIDLSNYKNIPLYDASVIAKIVQETIFKVTGLVVSVSVLTIGVYSIVVGIYRKQKYLKK